MSNHENDRIEEKLGVTAAILAAIASAENQQQAVIDGLKKQVIELREQLEAVGAGGVNGRLMPGAAPVSGADGVPDDQALLGFAEEEQFMLFCDEDEFLQIARAVLQRFGHSRAALAQQDANTGKTVSVENHGITKHNADKTDSENSYALKEGKRNAVSDDYFRARPNLLDNDATRSLFDDGFDRGYEAARKGDNQAQQNTDVPDWAYAGVTVFVGDKKVTKVTTRLELENSNVDKLLELFEGVRFTIDAPRKEQA